MSDEQAGQLIKSLSLYVFEGRKLQSNDCAIKSSFTLIKTALDAEERDRQNGRIGGIISAEKGKRKDSVIVIADIKQSCPMEKILQETLFDLTETQQKNEGKSVAKNEKK
jgi:hypothetical protein